VRFQPVGMSILVQAYPTAQFSCDGADGQATKFNAKYKVGDEVFVRQGCRNLPDCPSHVAAAALLVQSPANCSGDYMEF
ncbi:unnamed protein product, partial [Effrenium voratum]